MSYKNIATLTSAQQAAGVTGVAGVKSDGSLIGPSGAPVSGGGRFIWRGGNDFGVLGDSVTQQNSEYAPGVAGATTVIATRPEGYMSWAVALSKGQIRQSPLHNWGLGGDLIEAGTDSNGAHPGVYSRVPLVIASTVGSCAVVAGHNDVTTAGTDYSVMISGLTKIYTDLLSAGIRVYLGTLVPISGMNSTQYSKLLSVNAWARDYARRTPGVVLVDWWGYINDYTAANPQQKASWTRYNDTLHPGVRSAYAMGFVLWQAIKGAQGATGQTYGQGSQADLYNAAGPNASMTANSAMLGTTGQTLLQGGVTNATYTATQVATGFGVNKYGGSSTCTIAATKESPRTDLSGLCNSDRQIITFSTTQSGGGNEGIDCFTETLTRASGKYSPGDVLRAFATVELINPLNVYCVSMQLQEIKTSTFQNVFSMENTSASGNFDNAVMEPVARTYDFSLGGLDLVTQSDSVSVAAIIRIRFRPNATGGASATVKIGDFSIRKVLPQ